jgi:hypothetical protein
MLREHNFIEQPKGTGTIGHMLRALGKMHLDVEGVAVPPFGARELREVGRAQFQFPHKSSPQRAITERQHEARNSAQPAEGYSSGDRSLTASSAANVAT